MKYVQVRFMQRALETVVIVLWVWESAPSFSNLKYKSKFI